MFIFYRKTIYKFNFFYFKILEKCLPFLFTQQFNLKIKFFMTFWRVSLGISEMTLIIFDFKSLRFVGIS